MLNLKTATSRRMERKLQPYGFIVPITKKAFAFASTPSIIDDLNKSFYLTEFERSNREPTCIDTINDEEKFSRYDTESLTGIRVLDMPIKFSGSEIIRVPFELKQFDDTIEKIIAFENFINPRFVEDCFAYLTVDQSYVARGLPHRNRLPHINSSFTHYGAAPGGYVSRSYIASDIIPKKFYRQPFVCQMMPFYDHSRNSILCKRFSIQKKENCIVDIKPYAIMGYNAFCVHSDDVVPYSSFRTMLRITVDTMPYRRTMNTHNPMFQYHWD